jgi:hypothetical protein
MTAELPGLSEKDINLSLSDGAQTRSSGSPIAGTAPRLCRSMST